MRYKAGSKYLWESWDCLPYMRHNRATCMPRGLPAQSAVSAGFRLPSRRSAFSENEKLILFHRRHDSGSSTLDATSRDRQKERSKNGRYALRSRRIKGWLVVGEKGHTCRTVAPRPPLWWHTLHTICHQPSKETPASSTAQDLGRIWQRRQCKRTSRKEACNDRETWEDRIWTAYFRATCNTKSITDI